MRNPNKKLSDYRDGLVALVIVAVLLAAVIWVKFELIPRNNGAIMITVIYLYAGVIIGAVVGVGSHLFKRPAASLAFAASFMVLWMVLPGDWHVSSVLLGAGPVCAITSLPVIARFIAAHPGRKSHG